MCYERHVGVDHTLYKLVERCFSRVPAEFGLGFLRIAEQLLHIGRPEKAWVNLHEHASCGGVDAFFVHAFAFPAQFYPDALWYSPVAIT